MRRFAGLVTMTVLVLSNPAHAESISADEPFVEHQATTLTVIDATGEPAVDRNIRATYYPGADVAQEVVLGSTNAVGELEWSPEYAGLTRIDVQGSGEDEILSSRVVSVRYARMPIPALVMFVFAVLMLFGGLVFGVLKTRPDED